MNKETIKNRYGLKIVTLLEKAVDPVGLVIVVHGLGGFKEQPHIETFAQAFKDVNYNVLRYDATHSFGESEGSYEEATTTSYYEDLEDVISWAQKQDWYIEPFVLVGHSLGSMVSILYAEKYPNKVKALAPIATAVSGQLMKENYGSVLKEWQEKGILERPSVSRPGVMKRLNWGFVEDSLQYDVLTEVNKLTIPNLLIVGDQDKSTPVEDQQRLFDKLSSPKELHIIKGATHNFRRSEYLKEIKEIFDFWIKKYEI